MSNHRERYREIAELRSSSRVAEVVDSPRWTKELIAGGAARACGASVAAH